MEETTQDMLKSLNDQLESCRQLLTLFQEERHRFISGRMPSKQELMETMTRKCKLLDLFEEQRRLLKSTDADSVSMDPQVRDTRRGMIREMATLLEQLLVIDQENERLLRELTTTNQCARNLSCGNSNAARPTFQRQMPLMPFASRASHTAVSRTAPPASMAVPERIAQAVAAAAAKANPLPRPAVFQTVSAEERRSALPAHPRSSLREYAKAY